MIALGLVYIVSLCFLVGALVMSPAHTYRGFAASINMVLLFASGLALAIHAL